jgi:hypothetical protein
LHGKERFGSGTSFSREAEASDDYNGKPASVLLIAQMSSGSAEPLGYRFAWKAQQIARYCAGDVS